MKDIKDYLSEGFYKNVGADVVKVKEFMSNVKLSEGTKESIELKKDYDKFEFVLSQKPNAEILIKEDIHIDIINNWKHFERLSTALPFKDKYWITMYTTRYDGGFKDNWGFLKGRYGKKVDRFNDLLAYIRICGYYANPEAQIIVHGLRDKISSIEYSND